MSKADKSRATVSLSRNECVELIRAATFAPSADNNQPWRFVVQGKRLVALLDHTRALPSDIDSMFDLIALGAAIENMTIAAARLGYRTHVQPSPQEIAGDLKPDTEAVAVLEFSQGSDPDPLFDVLAERHTSRKLFSKQPPDAQSLVRMQQAVEQYSGVRLEWLTSRRDICKCARIVAVGDKVRLQAKEFHAELFRQLRFSTAEADRTCDGLDVRTLELPWGAAGALNVLRRWSLMQWVHRLGLGWTLAAPTWRAVRRSGAIGVVSIKEADRASFLRGGQAFERLWLTANKQGLSLQPLGSLPIYAAHLSAGVATSLRPEHCETVRDQLDRLSQIAPESTGRRLLMLVRVGYAAPPLHRSLRRDPETIMSYQADVDIASYPAASPWVPVVNPNSMAATPEIIE